MQEQATKSARERATRSCGAQEWTRVDKSGQEYTGMFKSDLQRVY